MIEFIDIALIFIGASIVFVPLFHRLGFGSVIGYLLAGLVVGPFGLGLVKDQHKVLHLSEIGVVMLLFLIGLEIQPKKLWHMKKDLLGLGGLQILFSTIAFTGIGIVLNQTLAASVAIGFGLSLSSTAFALQTLADKSTFNTEYGKGSFAVLLMQDLAAIPALAVIPLLSTEVQNTESMPFWYVPLFIVLIFMASRFLIRPFFRAIAKTKSREIFTTTTLFIVLGVSAVMLKLGMSAALGTFIAGVLLADSEYRHELEANLDPFKSLLLGLFFMAIGMTVSLPLILERPVLIFGLTIAYLIVKMSVIFSVAKIMKLSNDNARMMSITIPQGGEFAFVIFGIVTAAKLTDNSIINILTVVVTLSMALNPLIARAEEMWAKRKIIEVVPAYDEIKDEEPQVIIAGFGRFGQMFGRILRAQGIPFVAIDQDPDQIDLLRKFGNKVYYGDINREDILEAAGVSRVKYVVIAIDDQDAGLKAAKFIREKYPEIKIFARARNRGHAFDYMDLGVTHIKRETFDSSVNFVTELLIEMGYTEERAHVLTERFKTHDEVMMKEQYKVRDDDKMFMSATQQAGRQLATILNDESNRSYIDLPK